MLHRFGVTVAAVALACNNAADSQPQRRTSPQTEAEAFAKLCTSPTADVTNTDVRAFAATLRDLDPADARMRVIAHAMHAGVTACAPPATGARITLPAATEHTRDVTPLPVVAIDAKHVAVERVGRFDLGARDVTAAKRIRDVLNTQNVLVVADRALAMRDVLSVLELVDDGGSAVFDLVVEGPRPRMLTFGFFAHPPDGPTLHIAATKLELDGKAVTEASLDTRATDEFVSIVVDPDVTYERFIATRSHLPGYVVMRYPLPAAPPPPSPPDLGSCAPFEMRFDDSPLTPTVMLARGHDNGAIELVIANKQLDCRSVLAAAMPVGPHDIVASVIAKRNPSAVALEQVAWDSALEDVHVRLVGTVPTKAGDAIAICVPRIELSARGHKLGLIGLAKGRYCGMLTK